MDIQRYYQKIVESLKLLSLPFDEQIQFFPEYVDVPFEIFDTFEKSFMLLPQVLESDKITYQAVPNLLRLHNFINMELRNPDFDILEAEKLCNSREWNIIRELSKEILELMNEPLSKPNPTYI